MKQEIEDKIVEFACRNTTDDENPYNHGYTAATVDLCRVAPELAQSIIDIVVAKIEDIESKHSSILVIWGMPITSDKDANFSKATNEIINSLRQD